MPQRSCTRLWCPKLMLAMLLLSSMAGASAQTGVRHVGFLGYDARTQGLRLDAFREALRREGFVEGRNIALDVVWADGQFQRLPALARELVARNVDVIVTAAPPAVQAARDATQTIPIVMVVHDPVGFGLAESLARPGKNVTGIAFQDAELTTKRLDLFRAVIPNMTRLAILWNRQGSGEESMNAVRVAALGAKIEARTFEVGQPAEIASAVAAAKAWGAQGMVQLASPIITLNRKLLVDALARERMPATCEMRLYVEDGCLMTYSADLSAMFGALAPFVAAILRGTAPGDLPIQQPREFEFIVNLRTAQALGVSIPPVVRLQMTEAVQ